MNKENPYMILLNKLITAIDAQIPLEMPNQVLLLIHLDTEEKAITFNNWIKSKLDGENLNTTETEIMRAAAKISKGMEP